MSGGSWNYSYQAVTEMGSQLLSNEDPVRRAFGEHLKLIADAMHDLEWVDSGDYGPGREHEAILKVLSKAELVESAVKTLKEAVKRAEGVLTLLEEKS